MLQRRSTSSDTPPLPPRSPPQQTPHTPAKRRSPHSRWLCYHASGPSPIPQAYNEQDLQQTRINAYEQARLEQATRGYHQHQYPQSSQSLPPPPVPSQGQQQGYYSTPTATPVTPTAYQQQLAPGQGPLFSPSGSCDPRSHPSGMFTRNLIGSLCVSAFKLTDPDNSMGVWFILQDLSVRTEGSFR